MPEIEVLQPEDFEKWTADHRHSCACRHWDAKECLASRCPERQTYDDEECECVCHKVEEDEEDEVE